MNSQLKLSEGYSLELRILSVHLFFTTLFVAMPFHLQNLFPGGFDTNPFLENVIGTGKAICVFPTFILVGLLGIDFAGLTSSVPGCVIFCILFAGILFINSLFVSRMIAVLIRWIFEE